MITMLKSLRFHALALLLNAHSAFCGRGASIRNCGFAMPGDCAFCEAIVNVAVPVTVTFRAGTGK
jgi:hypothetical protein